MDRENELLLQVVKYLVEAGALKHDENTGERKQTEAHEDKLLGERKDAAALANDMMAQVGEGDDGSHDQSNENSQSRALAETTDLKDENKPDDTAIHPETQDTAMTGEADVEGKDDTVMETAATIDIMHEEQDRDTTKMEVKIAEAVGDEAIALVAGKDDIVMLAETSIK